MINNPFTLLEHKIESLQSQVQSLTNILHDFVKSRKYEEQLPERTEGIALAMEITGLAKGTIYNLVTGRKIPHYKRNGRIYFISQDLLEWIKEGKRKTAQEL